VQEHATALADALDIAVPRWVERSIRRRLHAPASVEIETAIAAAVLEARTVVCAALRDLVTADVDAQRTNPLSILRDAVRIPTTVLVAAGVPEVDRDDFARSRFPDDHYDLAPATWADVDPDLVDPGITWGAAKAFTHKQRHR